MIKELLKQFGEKIKRQKEKKKEVRQSYRIVKDYRRTVGDDCYWEQLNKEQLPEDVKKAQEIVLKYILRNLEPSTIDKSFLRKKRG